MPAEAKPNPLAPPRKQRDPGIDPLLTHARVWKYAHSLPPDELAQRTDKANYVTPILGALAGDPSVTSKDVIKAAAAAAADGKIAPSEAVEFISQIPSDPKAVRPWLRDLYSTTLAATVHMKAAQMKGGTMAPTAATPGSVPVPAQTEPPSAEPIGAPAP